MNKHAGVLNAGDNCLGLNAVLGGIGKAALCLFGEVLYV